MLGDATLDARHMLRFDEDFQLTNSERRLICNYRAMKQSAQDAFVDISEEFAQALPAVGRLASAHPGAEH